MVHRMLSMRSTGSVTRFRWRRSRLPPQLRHWMDREHPEFVAGETKRLRKSFAERFARLGIKVYPSQANFLLLEFNDPGRTAAAACASLRRKGIAVRQFTAPSYGNCLRVTLGVGRELALARDALDEFMRTGK